MSTILCALIFVAWVFALGRTILNLALMPRLRAGSRPAREPLVSVVVPARNEQRVIERTIRALLASTYQNLEVIVVDDRSDDGTAEALRSIRDPRLTVISGEEPAAGWLGKPWALQQGSQRAAGELLLFVDADVIYAPEAIASAVAHIEKGEAGLLSLFPYLEMRGFWENVAMPHLAVTIFVFLPTWFSNRTRIPALALGGGPGNLIWKEVYDRVGGHQSLRDAVVDDIALARLVRRSGRRTEIVRADDLISLRMYHGAAEIIGGFTKNIFAAFGRSYVAASLVAVLGVVFHVLPYALAITGNRVALATVGLITVSRLILFRALRYRVGNALFLHPVMVLFWSGVVIRSMWLTGFRRQLQWRGRTYDAKQTRFGADR